MRRYRACCECASWLVAPPAPSPSALALSAVIALLSAHLVNAADPYSPGVERSILGSPASPRLGLPEIPAAEENRPVLPVLPPAGLDTSADELSAQGSLYITAIRVQGGREEDAQALRQLVSPYENRDVSLAELQRLREQISRHYLDLGFINTGARIPDQQVAEGVVLIEIVQGELTRINPHGQISLREGYLRQQIRRDLSRPLNVHALSENLKLLQQHPVISRLQSELRPGIRRGEAVLDVLVEERRPYDLIFGFSNSHSPSIGEYTLSGELVHHSLSGRSDSLRLAAGWSEGLRNAEISYTLPLNPAQTRLAVHYKMDSTVVVEAPFQDLDIAGDNRSYGLSLTHPLRRSVSETLSASLGIEVKTSRTRLLGQPFDFSSGSVAGRSRVSLLAFSQEWIRRAADRVVAARSSFKYGIDVFNPTLHDDRPDSRFLSWLGQLQLAQRTHDRGDQLLVRSELQLANDPLLTQERYALGGMESVRGYRTNQIVTDNAWLLSAEYRIPLSRGGQEERPDHLLLFADYGQGWNAQDGDGQRQSLYGVGLGYLWRPYESFQAGLYLAQGLRDLDTPGDSLQDRGVYFDLRYTP